ncbi:MAG: phosphate ABC transporter ATP-binding protein, partial [Spirochaetaceae bacterium]|nr:phosphate ABC transporter ATP-binding protein [Spirochaetaceae bacterium]
LDPNTTQQILSLIKEIQQKMNLTVVMITHQMEVVRDACESVAVIENGRVVECGKVKNIFTNPKTETTRDFIKNISLSSSDAKDGIVKWTEKKGSYLLHFLGSATGEPVLCRMAKEFDVCFNILAAGIAHLPDEDVGYMEADISGEEDTVAKAVAWLSENNVRVQKK